MKYLTCGAKKKRGKAPLPRPLHHEYGFAVRVADTSESACEEPPRSLPGAGRSGRWEPQAAPAWGRRVSVAVSERMLLNLV